MYGLTFIAHVKGCFPTLTKSGLFKRVANGFPLSNEVGLETNWNVSEADSQADRIIPCDCISSHVETNCKAEIGSG